MEFQVSGVQLILVILGSNVALAGALVFILKQFGPQLFNWMKTKIDEKNGSIAELVEHTQSLAADIGRLAKAICAQVEHGNQAQEQFLSNMREVCGRQAERICKLIERIETATEK